MSSAQQQKTSSGLITMIHKSRETILQLLALQNYDISEYEKFGVNEVHAMYTNKDVPKQLDMLLTTKDVPLKQKNVYVKFHLGKTLRVENIQDYVDDLFNIEQMLDKKTDTLIIIIKQEMNQTLMNILNEFWDRDKIFIILFSFSKLAIAKAQDFSEEIEKDYALRSIGILQISHVKGDLSVQSWALDKVRIKIRKKVSAELCLMVL